MRQVRELRRRVESIEDELGIEPPGSESSSDDDDDSGPHLLPIIGFVEDGCVDDAGAAIGTVLDVAIAFGIDRARAEHELEKLRRQGEVYEPQTDYLRRT